MLFCNPVLISLVHTSSSRLSGFQASRLRFSQVDKLPVCLPCSEGTVLSQNFLMADSLLALSLLRLTF